MRGMVGSNRLVLGALVMGIAFAGCGRGLEAGDTGDTGVTKAALCPGFNPGTPDPNFCAGGGCFCGAGQGDCDNDAECEPGLVCRKNVGPTYGLPADYDVCEAPGACTPFSTTVAGRSQTHCTDGCPCGDNEGGCTTDSNCDTGLLCLIDRGQSVNLPTSYDVCMAACPPFDLNAQSTSFCTSQCPCGMGEGDCDYDGQCAQGVCVADVGATYGLPADWDVCTCPVFNAGTPSETHCSAACPCPAGEGDCDSDAQCSPGLVCASDVGPSYGLPVGYDVCEVAGTSCPTFSATSPSVDFCTTACPCADGEGNCSDNTECDPGLTCLVDRGPAVDLPTSYDVCMAACPPFDASKPNQSHCTGQCPCNAGEGDCDSDGQCAQGTCVQDNGATYGLPADWDACACPVFSTSAPSPNFCSANNCGTCMEGEGDCDSNAECDPGLFCIRAGAAYGLPGTYDVCTAAPKLVALTSTPTGLTPTLSPTVLTYNLTVGLSDQTVRLFPTVNTGATMTVNGLAHTSGARWTSPTLNLGLNSYPIVVSQSGLPNTTYTINIYRGGSQDAYIKASNTDQGDRFGVSLSVDGNTMVVGAHREASSATGVNGDQADDSAPVAGAAYVFVKTNNVWTQQAYLKASNAEAGDQFGLSVAISGDTIIVGAPIEKSNATGINGNQADNSVNNSGAAYVFTRSGTTWTQQAYLKSSNSQNDQFGFAVAASGDTVVVGARFEDSGNPTDPADNTVSNSGAAYVFKRTAGVWTQEGYLKASNPGVNDNFGAEVAISGDTVAVRSTREDSNATGIGGDQANNLAADSGAVYVFTRAAAVWTQQAYIKSSNSEAGDQFGSRIALDGDTLLVTAQGEDSGDSSMQADNSALESGAAYVFTRTAGVWAQTAYIKASNVEAGDNFGFAADIQGTLMMITATEEDSAAIGSNGDQADNSAAESGAVYIFTLSAGVWTQTSYLKPSNTEAGEQFGFSVGLGTSIIAIASGFEGSDATGIGGDQTNDNLINSGAVYSFK